MSRLPIVTLSGKHRIATLAFAAALAIAVTSSATAFPKTASHAVTVRCNAILKPEDVTDGGVSGTGHCTLSGAINDKGQSTDYRKQIGNKATVRRVVVGRKGTIAFLITINLGGGAAPAWSVTSGSRAYQGLHGKGREVVDDFSATPAVFVMKGTVSR